MTKPYRLTDGQLARDYQLRASHKVFTGTDGDGTATIIDMGLGKTFIVLQAINDLITLGIVKRVLVVAPILVCETVWKQEAAIWNTTNKLTFSLMRGTRSKRMDALLADADVYLINPELIGWLSDEVAQLSIWFDMLVVDESSMFKSANSKRFKTLMRNTGFHPFKRSVILTGTPAPTSLLNLWPQIYILDHGDRLHETFTQYRDHFFYKQAQVADHIYRYGVSPDEFEVRPDWMPKEGAPIKIHELIADIAVELNGEDYGVLPPTIGDASKDEVPPTHSHRVELPPDIRELYDRMEKEALIELGKDFIMAANGGARSLLCEQIASGFVYHTDEFGTQTTKHLHDLKLDKLCELLDILNTNCLITYHFVADRERIMQRFARYGIPITVLTSKNADTVINRWNRGLIPNLLLHPQSASHGINLQEGGHNIIWYNPMWSNERYQQANARIARSGQKNIVGIHHIVASKTVDELKLLMYRQRGDNQTKFRAALRGYQELRGWSINDTVLKDIL
jgi:SNF2 family DNA or RNA helicase